MGEIAKRYAVVTGGNRGLGWGIVKLLASKGVTVVLTARDEKRGLEAVGKLKESGLSDHVVFHQLDVAEPDSIASLAEFIKCHYGKLDILVNNAGVAGNILDTEALAAATPTGAEHIPNDWAKGVLGDVDSLKEDTIDELLSMFLNDFKEGCLETKGWPNFLSAYTLSKAALNAYTRILSKKYPSFSINCICPGFVRTDMNSNTGTMSVEEAAAYPVMLALLPDVAPSGLFFVFDNGEYSFYE